MKKFINIIFVTALLFIISSCASTIKPGKMGLMWRPWSSGLDSSKVYVDGIVWHWPWNNIKDYEVQWNNYREQVRILTGDDLHMDVTVSVGLRPNPKELYALDIEVGPEYYERLVKPELYTLTRTVMADYNHLEIPEESSEIESKILSSLRQTLDGKHIDFSHITLDHIMYSPLVTKASDLKLATKQLLEQKDFETGIAKKDAEIQRITARGQRDAQIIIDEGLTKKYLQFKALEVQESLSKSSNSKFYFVPMGKDGIPIIIDTGEK